MPNSVRAPGPDVPEDMPSETVDVPEDMPSEIVDVTVSSAAKRLMAIRAGLSALIGGLGALASAATGDTITLNGWLTAAAVAAAAAGAVYGVRPPGGLTRTEMSPGDLEALRTQQRKGQQQ